jgi:hypothetical protein
MMTGRKVMFSAQVSAAFSLPGQAAKLRRSRLGYMARRGAGYSGVVRSVKIFFKACFGGNFQAGSFEPAVSS